jgi:hypothetical protein
VLGLERLRVEVHAELPPVDGHRGPVHVPALRQAQGQDHRRDASGWTSRPLAFIAVIASRAVPESRPVFSATRATDWSVIGVSTKPGADCVDGEAGFRELDRE